MDKQPAAGSTRKPEQTSAQRPTGARGTRAGRPAPKQQPATSLPVTSHSLVEAVSAEVVRKLRLASEAEVKDDRETVLEEVFCDCTGLLDPQAQAQLGVLGPVPFYVVLAKHYATTRGADAAVAVLHLLQGLYGQGYAAPLAAMLLHRWLLLRRTGGLPEKERTRLAHVVALGAAQLFLGDVHTGATASQPLWHCLCYEVILGEPEAGGWATGAAAAAAAAAATPLVPLATRTTPAVGTIQGAAAVPEAAEPAAGAQAQPAADVAAAGPWASPRAGAGAGREAGGSPSTGTGTSSADQRGAAGAAGAGDTSGSGGAAEGGPGGWGLASLPLPARTGLLAAVAAFLLYYTTPGQQLEELLLWFPPASAPPAPSLPSPQPGSSAGGPRSSSGGGGRQPPLSSGAWQGVDFIMLEVVDMLGRIRSEAGLVRYLAGLQHLQGQAVLQQPQAMRTATRLRLQGVLYALSSSGGPHYPPRAVRAAALATLDALFPAGATTRSIVRTLFRVLHPSEWLGELLSAPLACLRRLLQQLALAAFMWLHALLVLGRWGPQPQQLTAEPPPATPPPAIASANGDDAAAGRQEGAAKEYGRLDRRSSSSAAAAAAAADVPSSVVKSASALAASTGAEQLQRGSRGDYSWLWPLARTSPGMDKLGHDGDEAVLMQPLPRPTMLERSSRR